MTATPRELTIAVVCFPGLGGSGIIGTELAAGLAQRGHRLHVIAERPPSRVLPQCSRLHFHEVSAPSYPLFDQAPYTLALAGAIARVVREQRADLLHVHYAVPHAASAYLARQALGAEAPRLINTLHGTDVTHVGADANYQSITRFCVEASDAISVPSEFLREQAHHVLGIDASRSIEVIPNFVDVDLFAPPERREPELCSEAFEDATPGPLLFHVSNFRSVKRVTDLLEVLARVRKSLPARLLLVGDGPERPAAVARARSLGVQRNVCFLGKRAEISPLLRHADAFLLTSESESFGLAALEALSCGVPVLGYRVGGVPAVVSEDVGRLVEPFDVDALARAVVSVVGDPALREQLGAQARARVLANFRREPALEAYERLYLRVLGGR
ncbi:MAG TPA: N-acetyl-alpha-D-glucosaminyl L-malate synthase BshA [Polyangiales bacterium]|nr:N-acetyl-alpha-D-glucosaminyl L-malate synthase BshA [Polyangiales bacterium]